MNIKLLNLVKAADLDRTGSSPMQRLTSQSLRAGSAAQIKRATRLISAELETFEKQRVELLNKYWESIGDGKYKVIEANREAFTKEFDELLAVEVDLPIIKIKLSTFAGTISAGDLDILEFLFEDDVE